MSDRKKSKMDIMIMDNTDNVAVCLHNFEKGETVSVDAADGTKQVNLLDSVPLGLLPLA